MMLVNQLVIRVLFITVYCEFDFVSIKASVVYLIWKTFKYFSKKLM